MPLQISNIIATATVATAPDLDYIMTNFSEICKYNPIKFPGLSMKIIDPKCTVLMFKSGKIVLTGLKEQKQANNVIRLLTSILGSIDNLTFNNFVGTFDQGHKLNLVTLYREYAPNAVYEMELFPALQLRLEKCTALVFTSGKCILTGCSDKMALYQIYVLLHEDFKRHCL